MFQNNRTKLSKAQWESFETLFPANKIMVRIDKKDIRTKSGVLLSFNEDNIYAEGEGSHAADVATVFGTVAKVPEKIYFHPRDVNSLSWEPDGMDIQVGDYCWSHPLNVKNADEVEVEGAVYQSWPIEDVYCLRRGGIDGEVICLNGNVILEPVKQEKLSELDVLDKNFDTTRAIVRFVGKPNLRYQAKECADIQGLKPGDTVVIDAHTPIIWLERFCYNTNFDHGRMYYAIQARHIMARI